MGEPLSSQDSGGLFPRLQERFGLREDPLAMESPFYPDAQRQHALETLRHLCGFGDMALLLTAPPGFGKTRILGELVRSEGARLEFLWLPAAELTSAEALARLLYQSLGRSVPEHKSASDAVFGFMDATSDQALKGRRQVILMDDAEQASEPVLKLLLRAFMAADTATAAIPVIAGLGELVETLGNSGDNNLHHIQLPPLTETDIRGYLQPRIRKAGGPEDELLSATKVRQLVALSQGSFGRLRRTAPGVWLGMTSSATAARKVPGSWRALRWVALALVLLAGSWWLVSAQYDRTTELTHRDVVVIDPPVRAVVTVGPDNPVEELPQERPIDPVPLIPDLTSEPIPEVTPELLQEAEPVGEVTAAGEADTARSAIAADEQEETQDAQVTREAPGSDVTEPVAVAQSPAAAAVDTPPKSGAASSASPAPAPAPAPRVIPEQPAVSEPAFVAARPDRFLALQDVRERRGWTLQLVAGNLERTVLNVLERALEDGNLYYTRGERQGQPWFMLLYGNYPSRDAAREAGERLPSALGISNPWARASDSF